MAQPPLPPAPPQVLPPEGVLPRRFGGDKLAFAPAFNPDKPQPPGYCDNDNNLVATIMQVITDYRNRKKAVKRRIEEVKEAQIQAVDAARQAGAEGAKKRILKQYHNAVLFNAGWFWDDPGIVARISAEFLRAFQTATGQPVGALAGGLRGAIAERIVGRAFIEEARQGAESGQVVVRCAARSHVLYTVYFGASRFPALPTLAPERDKLPNRDQLGRVDIRNVYVKIGHETDDPGKRAAKEFILDGNGVMTHRYVTRSILVYNLATMFGFRLIPPGEEPLPPGKDEQRLARYLLPKTAARLIHGTTRRIEDPLIRQDQTLAHQEPRYTGLGFGGHADTFDIRYAASYEPNGLLNPDFTPYRMRGTTGQAFLARTGLTVVTGACEGRLRTDPMQRNERASMQVRNGSGNDQPYLSTAALLHDYKVIRANKGERFDDSAENQGTVLIDLAIAKLMGIEIVNQYAVESDRFKIAYNRMFKRSDAERIERIVALKLLDIGFLSPDELNQNILSQVPTITPQQRQEILSIFELRQGPGTLESLASLLADAGVRPAHIGVEDGDLATLDSHPEALRRIMALQSDKFDFRTVIDRLAATELDEYIASARKNREILMSRIPNECIVGIRLNPDDSKWSNLPSGGSLESAQRLARRRRDDIAAKKAEPASAWFDFDAQFRAELGHYLRRDNYANTKAMFKAAVVAKRAEEAAGKNVT